jgi:hypothetical protein
MHRNFRAGPVGLEGLDVGMHLEKKRKGGLQDDKKREGLKGLLSTAIGL